MKQTKRWSSKQAFHTWKINTMIYQTQIASEQTIDPAKNHSSMKKTNSQWQKTDGPAKKTFIHEKDQCSTKQQIINETTNDPATNHPSMKKKQMIYKKTNNRWTTQWSSNEHSSMKKINNLQRHIINEKTMIQQHTIHPWKRTIIYEKNK